MPEITSTSELNMGYQDHDLETNALLMGPSSSLGFANAPNQERARSWTLKKTVLITIVVAAVSFASGAALFRTEKEADDMTSHNKEVETIEVELEGKKKKKKKKDDKKKSEERNPSKDCADGKYSKRTLKLAFELPFASLFRDHKGQRKYEASSVTVLDNDVYAVCDSSFAISKFGSQLTPFGESNIQIGEVEREEEGEESGYEALFHDDGTFYVVRESIQQADETYHAIIEELSVGETSYEVLAQCATEFEFEGDAKGFEGAASIRDLNNNLVILGLCEGNHCSETQKGDMGNGRIVAMRKENNSQGDGSTSCLWKTIRMIEIPSSAYFEDYSAITISDSGKVGITSQENSQFWVGQLIGQNDAGLWDVDAMTFDVKQGKLFDFPKNDSCETVYCNIEGAHWINDDMIIAVSDKMKGRGKQDFRCFSKDQSVHVFMLPA